MSRVKTLQELFKRYRRPGDIVFAWIFLILSLFLVSQLDSQAPWKPNGKTFSQPAFWPTVAVYAMSFFAAFHLLSSFLSERLEGRWSEVWSWVKSVEYAGWFMVYVSLVPMLGYLPMTMVFAVLFGLRAGYRSVKVLGFLLILAIVIVVVFKGFLQVKIPGAAIYEYLPTALRSFFLTYF
ncbi:tripartite tricarboxylate transporter TctB family protein [Planktotalea sp.]|uniref:tripartite tricarboxylate transporter TctB family protein n=1 Tax=Planktotalea sp. TaxID=2029877 RepID=UPI0035C82E91